MLNLNQITVPFVDDEYDKCVFETTFTSEWDTSKCSGKYYWLDFALSALTIMFPSNLDGRPTSINFVPVTFYGPNNASEAWLNDSEVSYAYNDPSTILSPPYMPLQPSFLQWMPGLRFVGPVTISPLTIVYRRGIVPDAKSLDLNHLAKLAAILLLYTMAQSAARLCQGVGEAAQRSGLAKVAASADRRRVAGDILRAVSVSLAECFLVLFFTDGLRNRVPMDSSSELSRELLRGDGLRLMTYAGGFVDFAESLAKVSGVPRNRLGGPMLVLKVGDMARAMADRRRRVVGVMGAYEAIYFSQRICQPVAVELRDFPMTLVGAYSRPRRGSDLPAFTAVHRSVWQSDFRRIQFRYKARAALKLHCPDEPAEEAMGLANIGLLFVALAGIFVVLPLLLAVEKLHCSVYIDGMWSMKFS